MDNYKFIISGGGTGGHIYPAIAIANELKKRYANAEILFVGAKDRMEMQRVPEAGYPIEGLWISGIQRKLTLSNLLFPVKLLVSLYKARKIVKRFKPNLVVGTGGYASAPLVKMASKQKIPCVLQEQNSYPGITNKWLSKHVEKIFVAYDGLEKYFPATKIVKTGNPVRQDLLEVNSKEDEARKFFEVSKTDKVLLVLGGSLGAKKINELVEAHLEYLTQQNITVLWQCGKLYYQEYQKYNSDKVKVMSFINRMDLAYAASNFIVSRAGASSVSELCIVGKPVIFIPSPNVAEDHQTKNALAVTQKNAALLVRESDAMMMFKPTIEQLIKDGQLCESLSDNIKELALPNATQEIVNHIEALLA